MRKSNDRVKMLAVVVVWHPSDGRIQLLNSSWVFNSDYWPKHQVMLRGSTGSLAFMSKLRYQYGTLQYRRIVVRGFRKPLTYISRIFLKKIRFIKHQTLSFLRSRLDIEFQYRIMCATSSRYRVRIILCLYNSPLKLKSIPKDTRVF